MHPDSTSALSLLLICRPNLLDDGLQVGNHSDHCLELIWWFTSLSGGNLVSMVFVNKSRNSFTMWKCFSTLEKTIMMASSSSSL